MEDYHLLLPLNHIYIFWRTNEQARSRHTPWYRLEQVLSSDDDKAMHVDRVAVDKVTAAQPSIDALLILRMNGYGTKTK